MSTTPSKSTRSREGLRGVDRVLSGHGIDDHEDLVRLDSGLDRLGLVHHLLVDMQTSGRVDDHDVAHGRPQRP